MNPILARVIDDVTPKVNKVVTEGAAKQILELAPDYLNDIIISGMRSVKPEIGLEYHGWRKLTPKEQFEKLYGNSNTKKIFDMATSDFYMIELKFSYKGKPINKHLYLPFAGRGNLINISNTMYHVVPVLSDTVISPAYMNVFVRLLKDKLIFHSVDRPFIVDGERIPGQVIHSSIYRIAGRTIEDNLGIVFPSISLYILGEIGLKAAFKKYANIDNIIITLEDDVSRFSKDYKIYESTKIKPRALKEVNYDGHSIKILVPRSKITDSGFINNFIFGIIYTLDIFPEAAHDLINLLENHDTHNEKLYWRILLGRIVFKNSYSVDRIVTDMNDHFVTLRSYMDTLIKTKLKETNIHTDTFFDLLAVILSNYNIWLLNSKEYNSNLYNRYIDILYYLLYVIILGINNTLFDINRKSTRKVITEAEVERIFNTGISVRKIYGIVKSRGMNLALIVADSSSDIMYPKITALLEDQSRGNGVQRGKQMQFPESTRTIKGDDLILGSVLFLNKAAPSPRFRANMFLEYDIITGRLNPDSRLKEMAAHLDKLLRGKEVANQHILDNDEEAVIEIGNE